MGHPLGLQAITDHNSLCTCPSAGLQPLRLNRIEIAVRSVVWAHVALDFQLSCLDPRSTSSPPEHGSGITAVPA